MLNEMMELSDTQYEEIYFKDPLTMDLGSFINDDNLEEYTLTQADVLRPDIFFYNIYGNSDYNEIVLWINKKASVYELEIGEILYIPTRADLDTFFVETIK